MGRVLTRFAARTALTAALLALGLMAVPASAGQDTCTGTTLYVECETSIPRKSRVDVTFGCRCRATGLQAETHADVLRVKRGRRFTIFYARADSRTPGARLVVRRRLGSLTATNTGRRYRIVLYYRLHFE